jgi:membrane-associated protein
VIDIQLAFQTAGLIAWGGVFIIALLVFAETGFLLGLVIPGGETLVFTAGLLVSTQSLDVSIVTLLITLIAASIAGDLSGYFIGKRFGRKLYHKKDTWYFKQKYLLMAETFFKKHKRAGIVFGKFLPVIRPFSPVISGTTGVPFHQFFPLTLVASALYMSSFILAGYFLGNRFPIIKEYLWLILPISIILALIPVIAQVRKYKADPKFSSGMADKK